MITMFILIILPFLLSLSLYVLLMNLNSKFKKIILVSTFYAVTFIIIAYSMNHLQFENYFVILLGLLLLSLSIACPSVITIFYFEKTFQKKYEMIEALFFPLAAIPYLAFFIRPELIEGQPLPPDFFQSMLPLFGWIFDLADIDAGLTVSHDTSIITNLISSFGIFIEILISLFILCIIMRKVKEMVDNVSS